MGYNMVSENGMIKSFKHKQLEKFHRTGSPKGISASHSARLEMILDLLEAATNIFDMSFPGSNLHKLEPKTASRWAVKVSGNWRITFRYEEGDALEVDYEDYH